ncbi:hypothetical protein [Demequina gelatinilytica]|uniref:hypothetical protein n=1 Tax=Demequina gelatinilytica TaxID=1638980 RepID=UPI0012E028F4|nr:hypothetical protein [Demequina gelatinilytica]
MKKILATLFAGALLVVGTAGGASAYDPYPVDPENYTAETGWGAGCGFTGANWAMYFTDGCTKIIAGNPKKSENNVGSIEIKPNGDGTVTVVVDLNEAKAAFADPLKLHILYSDTAPTVKNPAPGQFPINVEKLVEGVDYKFYDNVWQRVEVYNVPESNYYAVHADLLVKN